MAIGVILGILFAVLTIGGIVLASCGFMSERKVTGTLGVVAAIAFLFLFIFRS